jgi:ORF6N domain
MQIIGYGKVEEKIIEIRAQQVILDSDVAELYGVETKQINQALSRNPDKFLDGYVFGLTKQEKEEVVTICDRFKKLKYSTVSPKAFTEKGLYMLATILKSPKAVETTIAIIETFSKVRELGRVVQKAQALPEHSPKQKTLMERTGDLIADLIIPEDDLEVTGSETTYEMNLAVFKIKRTIKKGK